MLILSHDCWFRKPCFQTAPNALVCSVGHAGVLETLGMGRQVAHKLSLDPTGCSLCKFIHSALVTLVILNLVEAGADITEGRSCGRWKITRDSMKVYIKQAFGNLVQISLPPHSAEPTSAPLLCILKTNSKHTGQDFFNLRVHTLDMPSPSRSR